VLKVVRSPIPALSETVVDPGRGRLYLSSIDEPWVAVFDLASESFLTPIPTTFRGIGAAISFQRDKLYVGLELVELTTTGFISVIDLALGVEERVISLGIPNDGDPDNRMTMDELAFGPGEDLLYATTSPFFAEQGILVVDPDAGELVSQIDLRPADPGLLGGAHDLHVDGGNLIVAATVEVALVPIASPEAIRFGSTGHPNLVPKEIAISPDRGEWAITTGDLGAGFREIQLMDAGTLVVIWRDRIPATAVSPQGVAFRPDGNAFLVVGSRVDSPIGGFPAELIVYLHR
jgi:DNA-binding beta-propeller fold protein YncE